ncbi:MAG: GtrA family protein [Eubacterium sp.]
MNYIKNIFKKYLTKEIIMYCIFGVLTTILNCAVYALFVWLGCPGGIANIPAWIIAVIFAYVTNKIYVFESMSTDIKTILSEGFSFISGRLITFGIEEAIIVVAGLLWSTDFAEYVSKGIALIIVTILNYVISKLLIFKVTD